jgi:hypothetical protein
VPKEREHTRPLPDVPDADMVVRLVLDPHLVGYAVSLRLFEGKTVNTVRLYDYVAAHGEHHMHRYNGRKKLPPEVLQHASIQAGLDYAVAQIRASGSEMIEGWRR